MFNLLKRHSTRIRLAIGLTSITVTFMLIVSFLKVLPDYDGLKLESQMRVAQAVAANGTLLLSQADIKRMEAVLAHMVSRDSEIQRAVIKKNDGKQVIDVGPKDIGEQWSKVEVPILSGKDQWGTIELHFQRLHGSVWYAIYEQPLVRYISLVSLLCFVVFFFYLGRMLKVLDPAQAIPDRVRSALDTMAEGLLVMDAKNNIVLANQAFSKLVDRPPSALVGMNCSIFNWLNIDESPFKIWESPWSVALQKGRPVIGRRIRLSLETGQTHTFMVNCSPVLSDSGKAGGVLVSFDDVTVLEQQEKALIRSKEEADQANQSKSDFLANMSHEIRTPMTAIMGFSEALRRGYGDNAKNLQYLDTITKNSNHLLELINDILDLSKVEAGQVEVERTSVKVYQTISDVVEVLSIAANNKGIVLAYEPQTTMPVKINTDGGRIRQVLTNLIGNAIKFTQNGSVTIKTRWDYKNNRVCVDVIDTGIGMTESQRSAVFDPFVQADSSITRRFGGTGLGLTISKRYAEALGGDIVVETKLGKGSCFTLHIDAGKADLSEMIDVETQMLVSSHLSEETVSWDMPDAHILVVDDCEENRDLIELLLTNQGLTVETVDSGEEAIRCIEKNTYNMVLMDVQMPGMDGYTAVGVLRQSGVKLPIFALTAHAMKGIEKKCVDAGFTGYIAKPIQIDLLIETVAKCVGGTKSLIPKAQNIPTLTNLNLPQASSDGHAWQSGQSIVSVLQTNAKYIPIISKFIDKFDQQLEDLYRYQSANQFDELVELAHKLKGSSGTVGFYEFTEPFQRLEKAASETDPVKVAENIQFIKNMSLCIDRSQLNVGTPKQTPKEDTHSTLSKKAV